MVMHLICRENTAASLKKQLIENIIHNRIYQAEELNDLFEEVKRKNVHLTPNEIQKVWNSVLKELNAI